MKKMLLVAVAVVALAGCKKAETADNSASNAAASTDNSMANTAATTSNAAAPAMVTANGSGPGTYDVTQKNGDKGQTTLNADGTYVDKDSKGKEVKGTWAVKDGKTCFTPTGQSEECYTESPVGDDGSFTATSSKGETVTVKKAS